MSPLLLLTLSLCCAAAAFAQSPPPGNLQARLHQLAIASDDLRHHLPDFTCTESFVSQELRDGKVRSQVTASGDLRVQLGPGGKPAEHFAVTQVNGRPSKKLRVPMFVSGGFQNVLDIFQPSVQPYFDFTASPGRIDFASSASTNAAAQQHSDTTGFVLLDADGNPRHLEHRIPVDVAHRRNAVPFGAIDLTRTQLGGATFFLSTHVIADIPEDKSTYHWEASYSNCRLFTVTVKISPAQPETAGPTP